MKLWDFVKKAGTAALRDAVPGGGVVVDLINEFLPEGKQLPGDASGNQAAHAVESLPPEWRAKLMEKELSIQETEVKEEGSTLRAALETEARSPHTTRPRIALGSFYVLALASLLVISSWCVGILRAEAETVKAVADGWPFLASVVTPFVVLLRAYFGVLRSESRDRIEAAAGSHPRGVGAILGTLLNQRNDRK